MKMQEVVAIAKDRGIKPGRLKKQDLIRHIQTHEGNFGCFGTACNGDCDQHSCLWREDCIGPTRKLGFRPT